jgi:hypothetical protein
MVRANAVMLSCDTCVTPRSLSDALAAMAGRILQAPAKKREPGMETGTG